MNDVYSYSRLETFKQCPRKYAYQYIERPEVEKIQGIEAYMGTICHETVQQIYKDLNLNKKLSMEEVLSLYDELWAGEHPESLKIIKERYEEDNYRLTGKEYVELFYRAEAPFQDGKTIGIEKSVHIDIDNDKKMVGYIDRLVDHGDGFYEIIDYKTNSDLPSIQSLQDNWQLPLYHLGLSQMYPDLKRVKCTWHFLAFNKKLSIEKTQDDLKALNQNVAQLIAQIEANLEYEPRVSALCSWCDYEILCPARKHLCEVSKLNPEDLTKEAGVQMVEKYCGLKDDMARRQLELDQLGAKIYIYAKEKNLMNLWGAQHKLRLWERKNATKLVTKEENPAAQVEIVKLLKDFSLFEEYSYLSGFGLAKALDENRLPKELAEKLRPYVRREDVWRLYPGKISAWERRSK